MDWIRRAEQVLDGIPITRTEALLALTLAPLNDLLEGARMLREHFWGRKIILNYLVNAQSGLCPEDCAYCSQSRISRAEISRYPLLDREALLERIEEGVRLGAGCICLVTSGRGPGWRIIERIAEAVQEARFRFPDVEFCACLGLISGSMLNVLRDAGVDKYNHNLNTSHRFYSRICRTHTYEDRVRTVQAVRNSGMKVCSGLIVGMGESLEDIVDVAMELRRLKVQSVPVNFLLPIPGTPLGRRNPNISPEFVLRVLAMFRYVLPEAEIRISAGREQYLPWKDQVRALDIACSLFLDHYLTVKGQGVSRDLRLVEEARCEPWTCRSSSAYG